MLIVTVTVISLLVSVTHQLLMFDKVEDDHPCLLAMCDQDSGCVPLGCSVDQFDRIGCGYFRLNIYQFQQCYQPGKKDEDTENEAWMNCAQDYQCSASCIRVSFLEDRRSNMYIVCPENNISKQIETHLADADR
nr:hypothetical protein C55F2.2 - Caenorhabditis elegans [Caenorhabditis elegans]